MPLKENGPTTYGKIMALYSTVAVLGSGCPADNGGGGAGMAMDEGVSRSASPASSDSGTDVLHCEEGRGEVNGGPCASPA